MRDSGVRFGLIATSDLVEGSLVMQMVRSANTRKRNIYLALAVSLLAVTFVFYVTEEGMQWMMWRDSTLLAIGLVAAAALFGMLWWRTPRD